jgi:glycine oxidase
MVDITIRGAGIFGLSIAWTCLRRGASVQVIDPYGPGAGSSGGIVGALAPHVPENWNDKKAFQLSSLLMAEDFWAGVAAAGGTNPGYCRSGRLQPVLDPVALGLARGREETARALWEGHARWEVVPAKDDDGWQPRSPTGWIIRDDLSALLHPRKAVAALVAALQAGGVRIASEGKHSGTTLWATGVAGLEDLNSHLHRMVGAGVKGQAALLDYDARGAPQLFIDGLHIIPHLDGTVAIGSTSERQFKDGRAPDNQLDRLVEKASAALPVLRNAPVIDRWAGVRPRSRSRAPMLGPWPDRPGHFVANGGFKIGFGMAPKVAEVMADLLLEDRDRIPDAFRVAASF